MKRFVIAILTAAALLLPLSAAAAPANAAAAAAKEAFAVYSNPAHGITAEYPAGWKAAEGLMGAIVSFRSPLEAGGDRFSENVNILWEDVSAQPGLTVARYAEAGIAQLALMITDFRLLDNRRHTMDGRRARLIEYTGRQGVFQIHVLQAMTIAGGKAYVLTFVAEEADYERYLPVARRIMDTFAIK